MKKYLSIVCIVLCCAFAKACTSASITNKSVNRAEDFQKFISHQVKKGETVYGIAKQYGISEKQITKLNPDAKEGIYEGLVLILPATSAVVSTPTQEVKFKTHKVKRRETLYSISKRYGVPQEVIKRYNKQLYSQTLRKGDKIRIPSNYDASMLVDVPTDTPDEDAATKEYQIHKVDAKETKYGIARKYGITITELEMLNPQLSDGLKVGDDVKVPKATFATSAIIDTDKYAFYEVEKGNTVYSLLKLFNMEADALAKLNPVLDEGLKEGMILKVPKGSPGTFNPTSTAGGVPLDSNVSISEGLKGTLLDSLSDFSEKRVAIMLPFGVNRANGSDTAVNEDLLKKDRILRLSLDLYSGMLMATEDAKKLGISVVIDTYDTDYVNSKNEAATNARKVEDIIRGNNFSNVDAVIGPLLGSNLNRASSVLRPMNVPVISPLSSNVNGGSNVFISKPSDNAQQLLMLEYLKQHGQDKNIIILADAKSKGIATKLKALFPSAKTVTPRTTDKGYYLNPNDIPSQLLDDKENWIILETNDVPLISNVTTNLNAQIATRKVTLFTTSKGRAYDSDEIQHTHLSNLNFHFPSVGKEYKYKSSKAFIDTYESMYGVSPSEEAIRGYDLMYDTLLRLTYAKDLYSAAATGIETDYIENKFRYTNRSNGGFSNEAVYLLRYTESLELEEVKTMVEE